MMSNSKGRMIIKDGRAYHEVEREDLQIWLEALKRVYALINGKDVITAPVYKIMSEIAGILQQKEER